MAEDKQQAAPQAPGDINARSVLWGGIAIALGTVLAALAAYLLWQWWNASSGLRPLVGPNAGTLPVIASPVLQSAPQQERAQYFAEKRKLLESWTWVDRQHGIARIPVEEAMRIMAARGGKTAGAPKEPQ